VKPLGRLTFLLAAALCLAACAFVPRANVRLEEARTALERALADEHVTLHAAAQLRQAAEILQRATIARDTLDDPALVDHLAYLAKQRVAIAREAAQLKASQRAISTAIR
jgi:uncharacterized protein DUF4398